MRKVMSLEGIVSLVFVIVLFVPFLTSLFQSDREVSASEKRKLAPFPDVSFSRELIDEFPRQFEKYYDDHFGLRGSIVRIHNYVLAKLFGVSPTPAVVVGNDNWYFLNVDGAISDYIGRARFGERTLEQFQNVLLDRKAWLESMGTDYLFLPVPNKVNVYGDELPLRIRRYSGETKYDQIVSYLKNRGQFGNFIDTQEILREGKKNRRTYLQTDSHWNHDGVYLVYREIIEQLRTDFPGIEPLEQVEPKEWFEDFSGDLSILMNLSGLITERAPKNSAHMTCEPRPNRRMSELRKLSAYHDTPKHRLPAVTGCDGKEHKAVVIHDSFGNFLRPYLTQHFKEVIYIRYMNFENAKALIEREKPDVVIDQRVARNIQKALRPDPDLEQMLLSGTFDRLPQTLMEMADIELSNAIVARKQVTSTNNGDGVNVSFSGNKSSISLRLELGKDLSTNAVVRVTGSSSEEMQARICYRPGTPEQLGEQQCVKRVFAEGDNDLVFRIVKPTPEGVLSIVSGEKGAVVVKRVVAKNS